MLNITKLISVANNNSSLEALKLHELNFRVNKITPLTESFTKFVRTILKKESGISFRERLINSCILSFTELIKYLKLLKLDKQF